MSFITIFFAILPFLLAVGIPVFCIVMGMQVEKNMLRQIEIDEKALAHIKVTDTKDIPEEYLEGDCQTQMVCGSITIAGNYLYSFFSSFRAIFGGSMNSYLKLMEIARRSAMIRLKKAAAALNSDCVVNMRCSTANIMNASSSAQQAATSVEVLMYGTAVIKKS